MDGQGLDAATVAFGQGDYLEALTLLSPMIGGTNGKALSLLGETLEKLGLPAEAAEAFEQAARLEDGGSIPLLIRAASLYFAAGDDDRAQLLGTQLLKRVPDNADLAYLLARSFRRTGEFALVDLVKASLARSDDGDHLTLAGEIFNDDERNPLVLDLFRKLAALHPDDPYAQFKFMSVARDFCDFDAIEELERALATRLEAEESEALEGETAYSNLLHCGDERLNRLATNNPGLTSVPSPAGSRQRRTRPHQWGEKIRIGYLSNDFWSGHATMRLLQSVLEAHDRDRFDIRLYCYTPLRHTAAGDRSKWGEIHAIGERSDAEAADLIRQHGIDILVDLKGHTGGSRSNILNQMAAPVQVAWLGFPGSAVNIDCDYVIGDHIVLPASSRRHYHEKFCLLPETYQPNDPVHRALPAAASRADLGLPEDRFVFAAFNAPRKISLAVIDLWAGILRRCSHAVLWVMVDSEEARANLLSGFAKRGVGTRQIVFAPSLGYGDHIARLQAADVGLDTFPYNGHTTTSDKLWAGLPVVTLKGSNFASRVSESLLTALGLPELVAATPQAYANLAVALAGDAGEVSRLKQKITQNRFVAPLFDAERFCRHLERGYEMMAERARARLAPEHLSVPALPARDGPFQVSPVAGSETR